MSYSSIQSLTFKQLAATVLARVWLVFSSTLVVGVAASSVLGGGNPLQSDDPHLVGFFFAFVAAGLAFLYSITDYSQLLSRRKHWIIGGVLTVWCLICALLDAFAEGEADGVGYFIAAGSFIAGIIGWLVCALRFPAWIRIAVSAVGLAALFVYGCVVFRMKTIG